MSARGFFVDNDGVMREQKDDDGSHEPDLFVSTPSLVDDSAVADERVGQLLVQHAEELRLRDARIEELAEERDDLARALEAYADAAVGDEQGGADEPDGEDEPGEGDQGPDYDSLTRVELEAAISQRNQGREESDQIVVQGKGNKPDLVAALELDDAAVAAGEA